MLERLAKLGNITLDFLQPLYCLGCRQEGSFICSCCCSRLPRLTAPCYSHNGLPQNPLRLRERGFNQSVLLARALGLLSGLKVEQQGLKPVLNTLPQAKTTSVQERHKNIQKAFACQDNFFYNKKIPLIDDVATTGATLNACANALKKSFASSVWGLTLARKV